MVTTSEIPAPADAVELLLERFSSVKANAAELLVDCHDSSSAAFVTVDDLEQRPVVVSYGELRDRSMRLAQLLTDMGVRRGDTVAVLMGKRVELPVALAAILRIGAVYLPLFTAFAAPAIESRLRAASARIVITEPSQAEKLDSIAGIETLVVGAEFDARVAAAQPLESAASVGGGGTILLLFTSGTTGAPKGVPVPLRALAAFACYMIYGLDVREDDVFWNAADPGWAYGLYYGILGPMAIGRPNILFNSGFSPETTVTVIRKLGVTNFAAAPTVYRALSAAPGIGGVSLRRASSAGEPLTPEIAEWAPSALGTEVRDHYGQTELGMVINNHWHDDLRLPAVNGSMGQPMPGFTCGIVGGQIAVDTAQSSLMWFTDYHKDARTAGSRFTADKRWYLTGDTGHVDAAGHFHFGGRDDDVIIMAGYRIGPLDVESVLITHPDVADVAVVGQPDELRGEVVAAFVVLKAGQVGTEELSGELQQLVKTQYAAHAYPRVVHFVDELPRTASGKVQRYLLKGRG
ncbi:AMP-binding protein [[Mycobacterium] wendilense]|uniref:AMP-binding protein n=1 Tax=[Mycobacterium] wendilense TaxID=3064284 RepID=A0ABN9P5B8_9MYCO|nr:AMP-binding protein [Mycolicibacterium sp. MU0050]CAJ1587468.1 AMP-binding protein [Mycolicibacterium sp. MU0050]